VLENHVANKPANGIPTTKKVPPTAAALTSIGICGALIAFKTGNQWLDIEATQSRAGEGNWDVLHGCCATADRDQPTNETIAELHFERVAQPLV
jgi:hypothetical protein